MLTPNTSTAISASWQTTAAALTATSSAASWPAWAATPGSATSTPTSSRHTLATQAINRGMRLEAIAAMLGHRNMEMTLVYARIANRVVADEYQAVSSRIDAQYAQPSSLPADTETPDMTRLRHEADSRMLGNGLCTRPIELDCRMETVCESCAYFKTGPEFVPVLIRQRDHARNHNQNDRAKLFNGLLEQVIQETT